MINAEIEHKKALKWVLPVHVLIGAGIVIPILVIIGLLLLDFDKTVEIVIAIIMMIILTLTVRTIVKAIHSVPSNTVHLVIVREIYYSTWKSGGLHFLFNNWPLNMRYADVNLQKIKIPYSWSEENGDTIQLADTSIEGNMLIEIQITDPMLAHFVTSGGFEDGVMPLVLSMFKDYTETTLATYSETDARSINGPALLLKIKNKYSDMDAKLSERGVKLVTFLFSGEPLKSMKDARAREAVAEHDAKTGILTGETRANIKITEINALRKQFLSEGIDAEEAGELAREIWQNDRELEAIEKTRGVISSDAFKGLSARRHRESHDND